MLDFNGVGAMGLRNGVEPIALEGRPRGLTVPPSIESIEDTEGGRFKRDLSPQSILEETFDKSSFGVTLDTLLRDSDLVRSDFDPWSLLMSVLDDRREVWDGVFVRGEREGEEDTLVSEGVLARWEEPGGVGMVDPNARGCCNLPNIGNL